MNIENIQKNALSLTNEMNWLSEVIYIAISQYFNPDENVRDCLEIDPPNLIADDSPWAQFIKHTELVFFERLLLALTIAASIRPQLLDLFLMQNRQIAAAYTEFGGVKGKKHRGFLPTGQTAAFILGDTFLERRFKLLKVLKDGVLFKKYGILEICTSPPQETLLSGALTVSSEFLNRIANGQSILDFLKESEVRNLPI